MRNASRRTKVRVAVALAIAIIVALVVTATTTGFSDPAVPSGDVATVDGVDNGTISQEDFDAAMKEGAQSLGLQKVPAPDDDQYAQLVGQVMQGLVLPIWVRGEAEERGITVDDDDVQDEYEAQKKQAGIKNQEDLEKILKQQNLTEEEVLDGIRDQLLQQKLLAEAAPGSQSLPDDLAQLTPEEQTEKLADHYGVSDHDVQAYYDTAKDKPVAEGGFTTPPTRTARVILNTSEDKINAAKEELEKGDLSDETWKKVAKKYSQDQTSNANGGELPQPVEQGSATPSPYEDQIFDAQVNELVGPIDTGDRGFLLLEVTKDTPGKTQPLDDQLKQQITAAIVNNRQQQVFYDFQKSFFEKWTARTYCTSAADSEFCSGYEAPETEPAEGEPEPPPVQSTQPIEPGTSEIPLSFPSGYQPTQGTLPQGPGAGVQLPATDATTLPAGATTIPSGATGATGTTTPPTTTP
ncbi:MAG: SurA N-terminal domain-containing protein [Solirubrobacterales bacterium]